MSKRVAVAILNWNGAKLLREFLPGVIANSHEDAVVYVIDNASSDESLEILQQEFPSVKVIINDGNYGYAGGYNRGLRHIDEEYCVLLNSDVEVSPNWLRPLIHRLDNQPQLAALQPKIKAYKQKTHFEYAGASGGYIDLLGYPFCRGRILYELEEDLGQYDEYHQVFWATGACLVIRKSAFMEAGQLNERLFAHMEEIDLCWRLHQLGYEVACEPASVVYHLGGGTLNKLSSRKTFLNFRNNLIIMFLNMPTYEAFSKIFVRLVLDGVAGVKFLLDRQPKHMLAVLRAHFSFYGMFFALTREKGQRKLQPLESLPGVYKRSMVKAFFMEGKRKFSDLSSDNISAYQPKEERESTL